MATGDIPLKVEGEVQKILRSQVQPGQRLIMAVSGGSDSTALAGILHQLADVLHFEILFAHLNHSLRGSDSDEDEAFVKSLGERLNVPVVCERCDVEAWAADKKISIEMAAREARHAFFRETHPGRGGALVGARSYPK